MKTRLVLLAAAATLFGSLASAAITTDALVTQYQAEGYTFIEVTNGRTQVKVEAVKGADKIEVIYDAETGAVLKTEIEGAGDDAGRTGVRVRDRNRDFVRSGDDDDDDRGRGRGRGRGGDDDDHDDHGGRDRDRDRDRSGSGGGDDD